MKDFLIFKKEYRLGFLLIIVFGVFLYNIHQTSEQVVRYFTDPSFKYYKEAFLSTFYLILMIISFALLLILNRNEKIDHTIKGDAFSSYILWTAVSFFPGWIVHLIAVIQVQKVQGSFMALEDKFWLYHAADISMMIGFILSAFFILRPAIHHD